VPYFPVGGFTQFQTSQMDSIAAEANASPRQVALSWLLHRAPNILLIPGTSSRTHLRENVASASVKFSDEALNALDKLNTDTIWKPPVLRRN
jgi:pyridoxine 4-dehydrogenase